VVREITDLERVGWWMGGGWIGEKAERNLRWPQDRCKATTCGSAQTESCDISEVGWHEVIQSMVSEVSCWE
jgi:hypothetical protein